jgi:predicted CoA-binding protein
MPQPTIAIVGASADRRKFGNRAVRAYASRGYAVFPIHPRETTIEGFPVFRSVSQVPVPELDRVSLYLPAELALPILEDIARKPVKEVWFNPGADSAQVVAKARALGLPVVVGCSIVDIGVDPHGLD